MAAICQLYEQAPTLLEQGIHLVSTDEMTGIQALERADRTRPMKPGRIEYQEFEYILSVGSVFWLGACSAVPVLPPLCN